MIQFYKRYRKYIFVKIRHVYSTGISIFLLVIIVAGCINFPTDALNPVATPTIPPKQPEPRSPLIGGNISGLPDDALVTIHVQTSEGWEALWGTRQGNGTWEAVVTNTSGVDYIVTAEADGYTSTPGKYLIRLVDNVANVVENGRNTFRQASDLDFHFIHTDPSAP
jgi:hypothetical protein